MGQEKQDDLSKDNKNQSAATAGGVYDGNYGMEGCSLEDKAAVDANPMGAKIQKTTFISKMEDGVFIRIVDGDTEYKLQLYSDYDPNDKEDIEAILHILNTGKDLGPAFIGSTMGLLRQIVHHKESKESTSPEEDYQLLIHNKKKIVDLLLKYGNAETTEQACAVVNGMGFEHCVRDNVQASELYLDGMMAGIDMAENGLKNMLNADERALALYKGKTFSPFMREAYKQGFIDKEGLNQKAMRGLLNYFMQYVIQWDGPRIDTIVSDYAKTNK